MKELGTAYPSVAASISITPPISVAMRKSQSLVSRFPCCTLQKQGSTRVTLTKGPLLFEDPGCFIASSQFLFTSYHHPFAVLLALILIVGYHELSIELMMGAL
ncbi:uncharacterized protein BDV14DRAFT_174318 [Aspergillus stella-maris]|uniref:uncharacterized protein n=1 Tax=Aspergillus stella-maris TaxID=1810926 RepID=UPI003CCE4A35